MDERLIAILQKYQVAFALQSRAWGTYGEHNTYSVNVIATQEGRKLTGQGWSENQKDAVYLAFQHLMHQIEALEELAR
jgi:hypothetical protein